MIALEFADPDLRVRSLGHLPVDTSLEHFDIPLDLVDGFDVSFGIPWYQATRKKK